MKRNDIIEELFFRAWNIKEKRMYPVISINTDTNEVVVDTIAISKEYKEKIPTLTYKYPDDVLVLQYIGTKDRNKKKIFNGDIIRWRVFTEEYSLEAFIKNDYVLIVKPGIRSKLKLMTNKKEMKNKY